MAYRPSVENLLEAMTFSATFRPRREDRVSFHWAGYYCDLCHILLHKPYINLSQQSKKNMKHDFSAKTTESSDIPLSPCLGKFVTVTIKNPVTPPFQQIFLPPRFWVVTWPAATRVSLLTTKGGREERLWERGCSVWTQLILLCKTRV